MLTLFALPKAFEGHSAIIQRNAIESWTRLEPRPEIILFGTDAGTAEIAAEFGLRHYPEVACTAHGTPRVDDLFERASKLASHSLLCYVNADIILLSDFSKAIGHVMGQFDKFLLISERFNLDLDFPWDFTAPDWQSKLMHFAVAEGTPSGIAAPDFFVFTLGIFGKIPPFAIGRMAWDNWLIYAARRRGFPVVDATPSLRAIHQNHDYRHITTSDTLLKTERQVAASQEGKINIALLPGGAANVNNLDASHLLVDDKIVPARTPSHWRHRIASGEAFYPRLRYSFRLLEFSLHALRPLRTYFRYFLGSLRRRS
jgi:hypothetical protein